MKSGEQVKQTVDALLSTLIETKPNDRGDKDRRWQIMITDAEKIQAYIEKHIVERD